MIDRLQTMHENIEIVRHDPNRPALIDNENRVIEMMALTWKSLIEWQKCQCHTVIDRGILSELVYSRFHNRPTNTRFLFRMLRRFRRNLQIIYLRRDPELPIEIIQERQTHSKYSTADLLKLEELFDSYVRVAPVVTTTIYITNKK